MMMKIMMMMMMINNDADYDDENFILGSWRGAAQGRDCDARISQQVGFFSYFNCCKKQVEICK